MDSGCLGCNGKGDDDEWDGVFEDIGRANDFSWYYFLIAAREHGVHRGSVLIGMD